jgi:hypothetical protein
MIIKGKVIETITREVDVEISIPNDSTQDQICEAVRIAGLNQPDSSWKTTSSDGVEIVTDIDEPLEDFRNFVAEDFYSSSDFNGYTIEDADGWEHITDGDEWFCTAYVRAENPDDPTIAMKLTIHFVPERGVIEYATLNGVTIKDSIKFSDNSNYPMKRR